MDQICPERYFRSKTEKVIIIIFGILHIWISLSTKFWLKLTILGFWSKFTQKGYFLSKTKQAVWGQLEAFAFSVVNINSTVVFEHFEISKISLFWIFWKRNWLSLASWALFILLKLYKAFQAALCKATIKFWSKFQFQIIL